jgi:hypothetical protein
MATLPPPPKKIDPKDPNSGVSLHEIHSDEPHEDIDARRNALYNRTLSSLGGETKNPSLFNVGKVFKNDNIDTGMIVSDKKSTRPTLTQNIGSAFSEWFGALSGNVTKALEAVSVPEEEPPQQVTPPPPAPKKQAPLVAEKVVIERMEQPDMPAPVVQKAATPVVTTPKKDRHIVVQKIRTFKQDVALATGATPPIAAPSPTDISVSELTVIAPNIRKTNATTPIPPAPVKNSNPEKEQVTAASTTTVPVPPPPVKITTPDMRGSSVAPVITQHIAAEDAPLLAQKVVVHAKERAGTTSSSTPLPPPPKPSKSSAPSWTHVVENEGTEDNAKKVSDEKELQKHIESVYLEGTINLPTPAPRQETLDVAPPKPVPPPPPPATGAPAVIREDLVATPATDPVPQPVKPAPLPIPPLPSVPKIPPRVIREPQKESVLRSAPVVPTYAPPQYEPAQLPPTPPVPQQPSRGLEARIRETETKKNSTVPHTPWLRIALICVPVICIIVGGSIYYNRAHTNDPIVDEVTPENTPTPQDTNTLVLSGDNTTFIAELQNKITAAEPGYTPLMITTDATPGSRNVTSGEFFAFLQTRLSPRTIRALDDTLIVGSVTTEKNEPYIILTSGNFDVLFSGMLSWEPYMYEDLMPLFGTATFTNTPVFIDAVRDNTSTRILYDTTQKEVLLYSFINSNTVVITTSGEALAKILETK